MALNIVVGSRGLIGSAIREAFDSADAQNFFLDILEEGAETGSVKIDLKDLDAISAFVDSLPRVGNIPETINVIYLAALDAKLGGKWQKFEDFDPDIWEDYTSINQTSLLYFASRMIAYHKQFRKNKKLHFVLFPSLYNYLAPDQRAYEGWPDTVKPFEYIGSKALTRDLSNYLNSTYAHIGVRSNCVVPQLVTDGVSMPNEGLLKKTLSGRGSRAREIADVVQYLIGSPSNLMGQDIFVDGGWSKI